MSVRLFTICLLLSAARGAFAQDAYVHAAGSSQVYDGQNHVDYDTGKIQAAPATGQTSASYADAFGSASSGGDSTADYGRLHAKFSATAAASNGGTSANGSTLAEFADLITATGSPGTTVTFDLVGAIDGDMSADTDLAHLSLTTNIDVNGQNWNVQVYTAGSVSESHNYTATIAVGSSFSVYGSLSTSATAAASSSLGQPNSSTALANFENSLRLSIKVATPGAGYIATSGTVYDTAVPEPISVIPLSIGLLCCVGRRRPRSN